MPAAFFEILIRDEAPRQLLQEALATLKLGAEGPMQPAFRSAAVRYLAFIRRRFIDASRGNGTWPPLARSTRLKRLRKVATGRLNKLIKATGKTNRAAALQALVDSQFFPILRDTNTLFASLSVGSPDNVMTFVANGVIAGTSVEYGEYHQNPRVPGNPPQRMIFVEPPPELAQTMQEDLSLGILIALQESRDAGTT